MADKFLDYSGLSRFLDKVKTLIPTKVSELQNDSGYTTNTGTVTSVKVGNISYDPSSGVVSLPAYPTDTNTHRPIQMDGTQILGNNTTALNLKKGDNINLTNSSNDVTINCKNYPRGYSYNGTVSDKTCSNNTEVDVFSISFDPGTYLIQAGFSFASNSTGYRAAGISTTSKDLGGIVNSMRVPTVTTSNTATGLVITSIMNLTSDNNNVYFVARQNSGGNLKCTLRYKYVRLY